MSFWRRVLVYGLGFAIGWGIDVAVLWPLGMLKAVPWWPVRFVLIVAIACAAGAVGGRISCRIVLGKTEVSR